MARRKRSQSPILKPMTQPLVREMSPLAERPQRGKGHREGLLNRITTRIRQSLELPEILSTTAREIQTFLAIDRVKVYRFASDGTGEVIAESIQDDRLPSLLGLRFPAEDIPPHARELFVRARQRVITNVSSRLKILNPVDYGATDQVEDVRYFPVDPCHIQYLSTMGVCSSLVIPILHDQQLWGLLACHHSVNRRYSERELEIVQLLVDQMSIAIAQSNLLTRARLQAQHEAIVNQISSLLHAPLPLPKLRQQVLEATVTALNGSGGRLYLTADSTGQRAQVYTHGNQPQIPELEELPFWQEILAPHGSSTPASTYTPFLENLVGSFKNGAASGNGKKGDFTIIRPQLSLLTDIHQEPGLKTVRSAFETTKIHSLLVIPLSYQQQSVGCLTIFRDEVETETLWAGRINRDQRNDRPRQSFETWREIKGGQALEWSHEDLKLAQAIGTHLYMAVMQRRVEETIRHQASHDLLTGLPNRLLFSDHLSLTLAHTLSRGELLAVVFLDLDGFKNVNDTLGHAVGDQLLQATAHRLKDCLREGDLVARWGGDEFTLLLEGIQSPENAGEIAQQILMALNVPFHFEDQELYIKASLGIAFAPFDGEDTETLLKNADAAMYRAKQQGRNNYQFYTPAIGSKVLERLVLENKLYKALEREEFLLYYQPQLDLKTNQVVSMEALIRWQSPELGLVPPNQFIPLAEESSLICSLGEWVLRTACRQNKIWQLMGLPPMRIAVNLSRRQLQQQNLVEMIDAVLQETGLDPQYLELEITETIAMQDVDFTISVLQKLKSMDIHISIDDFGTGYSSLSCLKNFPLDKLKIDRSFIKEVTTDPATAAIIRAIVALSHGLGLSAIAEGVEMQAEQEFLKSIDCDGIQGFFFSKPLTATLATELLSQPQPPD